MWIGFIWGIRVEMSCNLGAVRGSVCPAADRGGTGERPRRGLGRRSVTGGPPADAGRGGGEAPRDGGDAPRGGPAAPGGGGRGEAAEGHRAGLGRFGRGDA